MTKAQSENRDIVTYLRSNRNLALELPAPDEPFVASETGLDGHDLTAMRYRGIVESAGWEDLACGHRRRLWQTTQRGYAVAQSISEGPWPECPHYGFENIDGSVFTCGDPDCHVRYSREQAREVLMG